MQGGHQGTDTEGQTNARQGAQRKAWYTQGSTLPAATASTGGLGTLPPSLRENRCITIANRIIGLGQLLVFFGFSETFYVSWNSRPDWP